MSIYSNPITTDHLPIAIRTLLSRGKRGIGALVQGVSNVALWRDPSFVTALAGSVLIASAGLGTTLISYAVDDINDLLAPCLSLSPQAYREVMLAGITYGIPGGIISGSIVAALLRGYINNTYRADQSVMREYINNTHRADESVRRPLLIGALMGFSAGGIGGLLYSVYLQQVRNIDVNDALCSGLPPIIINEQRFDR